MTETPNSQRYEDLRLPYPGLRPFLDHEHDLLMGRDAQIEQVIERLRETHFVAVIGGSGSGKSSLIRAGVVPQLRAYAIPEAGDYWVPVVFTPGTTKVDLQPGQEAPPDVQTPVTRLAWKFAQVMQPSMDGAGNLALRDEVAAYLRQGAGLSRLVNAYHVVLPRQGPRTENARFLFVIDQFEELFHPNNRDSADTRLIIEAVIDHFRSPDPRTYVVMAMRSEHLADCAAYLNLPDAINRSFYFVRRPSNSELRDVITEPAQVMQRLVQRQDPARTASVMFQPPVVARLLADARRIEDDPDHLPLLQHLLARTWSAALKREKRPPTGDVPATVTMADLEAAVAPGPANAAPGWLAGDRKLNVLRCSLENWAEHIYLRDFPRDRDALALARIDELLAKLAYKDLNNGLYFQQRVNVDDPHLLQGIDAPRPVLWNLLKDGFLDTVNYLFWDVENPDHVTLKVSHEAFIRGWPRFRWVADREAERFEEFVAVLRRCAAWQDGQRDDALLLETAEIERIRQKALLPLFAEAHQRKDWFAVLRRYREGERLVELEDLVQHFIESSMARQQRLQDEAEAGALAFKAAEDAARKAAEDFRMADARHQADQEAANARRLQLEAETARANADLATAQANVERNEARAEKKAAEARISRALVGASSIVALVFVANATHTWLFSSPAISSVDQFVQSERDVGSRPRSELSRTAGAAGQELKALAMAAKRTLDAQQEGIPGLGISAAAVRERTLGWPYVGAGGLQRLVDSVSSEPLVNRELRRLLTTAVWAGGAIDAQPQSAPRLETLVCTLDGGAPGAPPQLLKGRFLPGPQPGLGLFVTDFDASPRQSSVLSARRFEGMGGQFCVGWSVFSVPASIEPRFFFDTESSAMAVVAKGQDTTLYDLEWNWDPVKKSMIARPTLRRVLTDPRSAQAFEDYMPTRGASVSTNPAHVLETRPLPGGLEVKLGNVWWRLFSAEARRLPASVPISEQVWQRLAAAAEGSTCAVLGGWVWVTRRTEIQLKAFSDPANPRLNLKFDVMAVPDGKQCILLTRIDNNGSNALDAWDGSVPPTEDISVAAYHSVAVEAEREQAGGSERLPAPFADWRFGTQVLGTRRDWWVGKPGTEWEGWLAATPQGRTDGAVASPYSTAALKRLADDIAAASPQPGSGNPPNNPPNNPPDNQPSAVPGVRPRAKP